MNFKTLLVIISAMMLIFSSCKKDEEEENGDPNQPVLNKNFSFTVTSNDVVFTTTITAGNVWFTNCKTGTEYPTVDQTVTVNIYLKGTYKFLCSAYIDGTTYVSDTFNVVIGSSDLTFLESGAWLWLTGGHDGDDPVTKTWKLDINSDGKCVYYSGPLHYSGYEGAGGDRRDEFVYWAWDVMPNQLPYTLSDGTEMSSFFNWEPDYPNNTWIMAANDYGTITFDGVNMTVETDIFGETTTGSFDFDPTTMKLTLNNVVLPIDTGRLNDGQYEDENLHNLRIFALADSGMQIGIKRTYEGGNESKWVNVYNFICDDYVYPVPEEFSYTEPLNTSITAADLEGTWVYAAVPQNWVSWTGVGDQGSNNPAALLNNWVTRSDIATTLTSWGAGNADSIFTANDAYEFVFESSGNCTLAGVANTYTVSGGVITFGTALTTEFACIWINPTGTSVSVIDVAKNNDGTDYVDDGSLWLGQKNGDKNESSCVHIMKK
ncbi:MAG: hypothetical protein JXB49_10810 [Bacteroidales bacterium]|nr:hypothetical protein [Bacteroidales bacterium]